MNLRSLTGTSSSSSSSSGSSSSGFNPTRIDLWAGQYASIGFSEGVLDAAHFYSPGALVVIAGFAYVVDRNNCTIRKIDLATNTTTTLAGAAQDCSTSDSTDGTGATARFSSLWGIAFDGTTLYVTEPMAHLIRRIDPTSGNTTTLNSGVTPGTSGTAAGVQLNNVATFNSPAAIAYDPTANALFVGEHVNKVIRRVDFGSGQSTIFAGTQGVAGSNVGGPGTGQVDFVSGITTNGTNTLFYTDSGKHIVRSVPFATGTIAVLAGTVSTPGFADGAAGSAQFNFPGGITIDPGTGDLYIADNSNNRIRRIGAGIVTTVAGSGAANYADGAGAGAAFHDPVGITYDGVGNFYIAEQTNNTIRKLTMAGSVVSRVAGQEDRQGSTDGTSFAARFSGIHGMVYDGATFVYVADQNNCVIRRVNVTTGAVSLFAGSVGSCGAAVDGPALGGALFDSPSGLALCQGKLFVSESSASVIRMINIASGAVTTFAGSGIAGSLDGIGTAAQFQVPKGLACNGSGTKVVVADSQNNQIRQIDIATAAVTTLSGNTAGGFSDGTLVASLYNDPNAVTMTGDNLIYVADSGNSAVREINISGATVATIGGRPPPAPGAGNQDGIGAGSRLSLPLALISSGTDVYVLDGDALNAGNGNLRKINLASGAVTTLMGAPSLTNGKTGDVDGLLNQAFFGGLTSGMVYVNGVGMLFGNSSGIRVIH